MADVANSRTRSESLEVKVVAADAEVFDNVGNNAAGHIARVPCERDEAVRTEGRVKGFQPHAVGNIEHSTSNIQHRIEGKRTNRAGLLRTRSPSWNKETLRLELRDGAPGFEQSFQMRFGRLLESKGGLATVAPVCMAAGQQGGFGNPHAIFILTELHFREWNDHNGHKVTSSASDVKEDG
ncbi:MAG: hypothetical protein ABSH15_16220 [Verrucomicrobiota bacterium]